jgi:uncharacterized sporulation protein YeaH/YhbH (DUF444 family)
MSINAHLKKQGFSSMTTIIDRRDEPARHKFGKDKARFLNRIRASVKKAMHDKVAGGSIKDFEKGGVKIPVPKQTTEEPIIHHEQGPNFKKVFPGNLYDVGDIIPIPKPGGGGSGQEGNPDAEDGNDDYVWLAEDEFLDMFFDGRSLPDMTKLYDDANTVLHRQRAGHTAKGPSHKMDVVATNQKRKGDELVLNKASERRLFQNLLEQYSIYRSYKGDVPEIDFADKDKAEKLALVKEALATIQAQFTINAEQVHKDETLTALFNCVDTLADHVKKEVSNDEDIERLDVLQERIPEQLKSGKKAKKFQDKHLTYHFDEDVPKPTAKAVMFCKMDVSYSMSQEDKNTAKAFFWILNKFLDSNYDQVDVVFISHTTTAKEVDEEEFFYGDRTGGTLVSSCLDKELEIMKKRYAGSEWNIYSAQASDGDNVTNDNVVVADLLETLLPQQQASYFIEVRDPNWGLSQLHETYLSVSQAHPNLHTASISTPGEAIEAFKDFFPVGTLSKTNQPKMG